MEKKYKVDVTYQDVRSMVDSMIETKFKNRSEIIDYLSYHAVNTEYGKTTVEELVSIFLGNTINYITPDILKLAKLSNDPSNHLVLKHRFKYWDYDEENTNEFYGVFKNPEDDDEETYYLNCDIVETFRFSKEKPLLVKEYYCDEQNNTKDRNERINLDSLHVVCDGVFYTAEEYLKSVS